MLTRQVMFNKAYLGVIAQGLPSHDEVCKYRGPNGTKCAVGHLIPDDRYQDGIETMALGQVLSFYQDVFNAKEDYDFLRGLQRCHDSAAITCLLDPSKSERPQVFLEQFKRLCENFAKIYHLTVPEIPKC